MFLFLSLAIMENPIGKLVICILSWKTHWPLLTTPDGLPAPPAVLCKKCGSRFFPCRPSW